MISSRTRGAEPRAWPAAVLLCAALTAACGQKGPPLAPLRLVPGPVTELAGRRAGDEVRLQFKLPTANQNGPGPLDLDHVEIYAVTVAPGRVTPANRDLLSNTYAVGTVAVKPPAAQPRNGEEKPGSGSEPVAPAEPAPPDPRPGPGEVATFSELLGELQRTPADLPVATPETPAAAAAAAAAAAPEAPADNGTPVPPPRIQPGDAGPPPVPAGPPVSQTAVDLTLAVPLTALPGEAVPAPTAPGVAAPAPVPAGPAAAPAVTYPVRIYVLRGISKAGRPGQPSQRVTVPLVDPPAAPEAPAASFTEKAVVLSWTPIPPPEQGPAASYNVYRADAAGPPLNASPLGAQTLEVTDFQVGREDCFVVRSVQVYQGLPVESAASPPACVTPQDTFAPSAPARLSGFFLEGAIELVWDTSPEPDVAGYLVLRGIAPGDTLQALTPEPVAGTTFRDTAVTPGTSYVYAVVAVDRAGNRSPPSMRVEGTAR